MSGRKKVLQRCAGMIIAGCGVASLIVPLYTNMNPPNYELLWQGAAPPIFVGLALVAVGSLVYLKGRK